MIKSKQYLPFSHLARSIFFGDRRTAYVAMYSAYFDASGDERNRVMSMGGFVSTVPKWERFITHWTGLLPPSVSMFHMTDFVSSKDGWEEWKGPENSSRRASIMEKLVDCIRRHTNQGFSANIRSRDYREANAQYSLGEHFGGLYGILGIGCLGRLKIWADRKRVDFRRILCIFEEGDEGQGTFIERAKADGFDAFTRPKRSLRQFDACDLAAWRSRIIVDDAWERQLHLACPLAADRVMKSLAQLERIVRGREAGRHTASGMKEIGLQLKLARHTRK